MVSNPFSQVLSGPLKTELRQGCDNRTVKGGLDRFLVEKLDQALSLVPPTSQVDAEYRVFLNDLRSGYGQYLALSKDERENLIQKTLTGIEFWAVREKAPGATQHPSLSDLQTPALEFVPRPKQAAFKRFGLKTVEDILRYTPKWVVDTSRISLLQRLQPSEEPPFLLARINGVSIMQRGPRSVLKVVLQDESGHMTWTWFNRPFLKREMQVGRWVLVHDKPEGGRFGLSLVGKTGSYEFLDDGDIERLKSGRPLAFYPSTPTLDQAFWRALMPKVLDGALGLVKDFRPSGDGTPLSQAMGEIHRPSSLASYEKARQRLASDELLVLQLFLLLKKRSLEKTAKGREYHFEGERILQFRKSIPFALTNAQKRVIKEIKADLGRPHPMNRLLQGDVGSGKTVVAAIALLYAADSGIQGAFLAPTEILAQQHFDTLQKMVGPVGLRVALLSGDQKAAEKRQTLAALSSGQVDVVVGTHALLEDTVKFHRLGLVILDERHKFGVLQRAALEKKGHHPDVLSMTATPFPRALVLTEYGDTELSILDEKPKGRKSIATVWKNQASKEQAYQAVRERVLKGEQAFLVYPVVEESKTFLKSAIEMHRLFQKQVFHGFRVGLLHGRMKKEEKSAVMDAFRKKDIQILVSTTVVEVGVDVPNATIMVVEHAERFGLAQLHQLRGRVGRGESGSVCYLLSSDRVSGDGVERMKAMTSTDDGFKLSELDLKLRGPGDIFGVEQSGRREGGLVDLRRDGELVEKARGEAQTILEKDGALQAKSSAGLREVFLRRYHGQLDLATLS
jgi:ATP-dependent DNA helicase RecG